ncbi:hypothetical protein N7533_000719 [Penicillium manginii]|uniref:uncharacterized protein n=1 Tax=Penicillium manginii TaxID=203109 RepID=UPI002546D579|nr:uncharacterized protein N7533_000719 [Penicillium manginii]KAJ5768136.1 hypothetical protein N7533_000719 [Penicillium manginii]
MEDKSSPDYKSLYLQAEQRREEAEQQTRLTTFTEYIRRCHDLSRLLRVETPSRSTTGQIPSPTGKFCPTRLEHWTDCPKQLSEIYRSVYSYFQPERRQAPRLFSSLLALDGLVQRLVRKPLSSEQELEAYERFAVEEHVHDIITELCKIPAARNEFGLDDGIQFSNHTNTLNENQTTQASESQISSIQHPRPDQFCIHRVDGNTNTLLVSVEYKPPHKLSVATLRMGLRPMDLWKDLVRSNKIPTGQEAKLRYNAERLVCSAIVQEYHVMIQEGLEYSYVTNGITRVLLRVPRDKPTTLYYFFCDPNSEVDPEGDFISNLSKTSVARVLCLCLMAFHSPVRGQEWRNRAHPDIPIWKTSFDHTRSQISKKQLEQIPHSDSTNPDFSSPDTSSSYELPSSPLPCPSEGRRVPTRSQTRCAPPEIRPRSRSPNSSGSDTNQTAGHKRRISQVTPSPSTRRSDRQQESGNERDDQSRRRAAVFCTQRCLLGLQTGKCLDDLCPNVDHHRRGQNAPTQHPVSAEGLMLSLKKQLDENIERCIPLGGCGSYGAPFKLTCMKYGYTVIGKGTTSGLWEEVSREAQVYQILRRIQGSAVPVFLGTIDLAKIYFLHGAGQIRHMLVMGWGGESTATMELTAHLRREIHRSNKEIKALGIIHEDLRQENVLWCEELRRALIIDFHRSTLRCRLAKQPLGPTKRRLYQVDSRNAKRLRISK